MSKKDTAANSTEEIVKPEPAAKASAASKKSTPAKLAASRKAPAKASAKEAADSDKKPVKAAKAPAKKAAAEKAKSAAKKTAAKKAAKPALVENSDQTQAEINANIDMLKAETAGGVAYEKAVDAIVDKQQEKVAEKAVAGSDQTVAEVNAAKKVLAEETKAGVEIMEGIAAEAKKVAAETVIADEAADGVKIMEGIDALAEKKAAPKTKKAPAKKAAEKKAPAKKTTKKAAKASAAVVEAYEESQSDQTKAQIEAGLNATGAEVKAGVEVMEGIAKLTAEETPVRAEDASRKVLAAKAAAHTFGQVNLAARSAKDSAEARKTFKKPARKAAKKVEKTDKEAAAEAINKLIPEIVSNMDPETAAKRCEEAAMASRKVLASKVRPAKGAAKAAITHMSAEEKAFYDTLDDNTLMDMMSAVGVDMDLDTLLGELTRAKSIEEAVDAYEKIADKTEKKYVFEVDGFSKNVIEYLCDRLAARIPNKAEDNRKLAEKIAKDVDRMLINEGINDSAIYKDLFDDVRQVLVYAQQNGIESLEEMETIIPADLHGLLDRFMTVAYTILPGWQHNDVKYYEGFLYSVMAQFEDLASWQNRALMDIADLYIKHGDYARGNDGYSYVLRENQLKDQIYYRFASVYESFDLQRAKGIVRDALRVIDGRYDYYPKLIEILEK